MAIDKEVDELGLSEEENLQIEALTLGAKPQEVATLSRKPISDIPQQIEPISKFSDEYGQEPGPSYFDPVIPAVPDEIASEKAIYASLAKSDEITSNYKSMYDQFRFTGMSPVYDSIQREIEEQKSQELQRFIIETAREGDVEGTQQLLEASPTLLRETSTLRTTALENTSESYTERYTDIRNVDHQRKFLDSIGYDLTENGESFSQMLNRVVYTGMGGASDTLVEYTLDTVGSALTGEQLLRLADVGKDILGERYDVFGGAMLRDLAQHLRNTPKDKQEEVAKQIVDSINKHTGFLASDKNDIIRLFTLEAFREFADTPGGDIPADRWLANTFGVVEAAGFVPVAGLAKLLTRLNGIRRSAAATRKYESIRDELQSANPDLEAILTAQAIKNKEVADELATTPVQQIEKSIPGIHLDEKTLLQGAPSSVVERFKGTKTLADEAEEFIENTYLYSPEAYVQRMKKIQSVFSDEKMVAHVKPSFSTLARDPNSNAVNITAVYGNELDIPLTRGQALKLKSNLEKMAAAEKLENPNIRLVVKDRTSKTYEPYDVAEHGRGEEKEFFVTMDTKARMTYDDIVGVTEDGTKAVDTFLPSFLTRAYVDPQSYIDRTLLGAARVALDRKFAKQTELKRLAQPFTGINYFSKRRVAALLKYGEEIENSDGSIGKVFKYRELASKYTEKEISAYYAARFFNDTVYNIKDIDRRQRLVDDGFKGLSLDLGDGKVFKNAFREADDKEILNNTKVIFDPLSGTQVQATAEKLVELRNNGLKVGRLLQKYDTGDSIYSYAVVRGGDIHELPQHVFPYRPGYNFRINNDPYFIDIETTKIVDGNRQKHTGTIGVARNANEAKRYIEKLQKEYPKATFKTRWDRNINTDESLLENDLKVLDGSGLDYWFSQRGKRLTRIDGSESSVEDPVSAINRAISSLANVSTHRELIETALVRHRKTYGNLKTTKDSPLWYWSPEAKQWLFDKASARGIANKQVKAALNEYEYIENLKYIPTTVDKMWKDALEGIDRMFSPTGAFLSAGAGKVTRTLASTTPGQFARSATFALTIPLRPFRHLLLQSSTGLHLFGIDPVATAGAAKDANLILYSMASWQNPKAWARTKKWARLFGYSEEEWEDIFTAFRKSGKAYSIDSHVAIGEANFSWSRSMPESTAGWVGQQAMNLLKSPVSLGKLGFDTGELANQAVTYMFTLRRWQKENPGKSWKNNQVALDEITNRARNYSIDMTTTSQFSYQKGGFAAATQFMAINHKMLLKILGADPEIKLGTAMHARYVLGLTAMYGAAGLGAHELYDEWIKGSGVEIPPELEDVLYGGVIQSLFNRSLELAFGEELGSIRLAVSDSLSPGSGAFTFIRDFYKGLMEGNVIEALSGPSGQVLPKIHSVAKYVGDVWSLNDNLNTPEKILKSLQVATQEFGSFSDYYKYNLTLAYKDKMGEYMITDMTGRPTSVASNFGEVFGKAMFAMQTRGEKELYDNYLKQYKKIHSTGKVNEAQVDKDADHLSRYMYETWLTTSDPLEQMDKMSAITFALHNGPDKLYGSRVWKKTLDKFTTDPRFNEFVAGIVEDKAEGLFDATHDFNMMKNAVRNSDAVSDEDKQTLIDYIDAADRSSAASQELMNQTF